LAPGTTKNQKSTIFEFLHLIAKFFFGFYNFRLLLNRTKKEKDNKSEPFEFSKNHEPFLSYCRNKIFKSSRILISFRRPFFKKTCDFVTL